MKEEKNNSHPKGSHKTDAKHLNSAKEAKHGKKHTDEKGTLQAGLGKDFLNDPGDPESALDSLI